MENASLTTMASQPTGIEGEATFQVADRNTHQGGAAQVWEGGRRLSSAPSTGAFPLGGWAEVGLSATARPEHGSPSTLTTGSGLLQIQSPDRDISSEAFRVVALIGVLTMASAASDGIAR